MTGFRDEVFNDGSWKERCGCTDDEIANVGKGSNTNGEIQS